MCHGWYMPWPSPGCQPLPSLHWNHHHQEKKWPNQRSNSNKKTWMIMHNNQNNNNNIGNKEHPYTQHPWKGQRVERRDRASERAHTIHWHTHAKIIWNQERRQKKKGGGRWKGWGELKERIITKGKNPLHPHMHCTNKNTRWMWKKRKKNQTKWSSFPCLPPPSLKKKKRKSPNPTPKYMKDEKKIKSGDKKKRRDWEESGVGR